MSFPELPLKAEAMFCHAVYAASHVINRAYAPHLAKLGLTYPQYITLTLLRDEDGQGVGALGKAMRMESSTLTPLVKRLEQQGFVRRQRGAQDERQVFVHLTQSGRSILETAPEITRCLIEDTGLDPARLDELVAVLSTLSDNLQAKKG